MQPRFSMSQMANVQHIYCPLPTLGPHQTLLINKKSPSTNLGFWESRAPHVMFKAI